MTIPALNDATTATDGASLPTTDGQGYVVEGRTYPTLAGLANAYGIKVTTLARRLRSKHWTIEQACGIDTPPVSAANQGKQLMAGGTLYPSMAAACLAHAVKVEVYHARRRTGWTVEEALGIVARPDQPRPGAKTWTVAGKTYFSLRKACEAHGLHPDRIRSRLSMGWTLEEAFDLVDRQPPAPVPADLRKGETGTIVICGQSFVWKQSQTHVAELSSISTEAIVDARRA